MNDGLPDPDDAPAVPWPPWWLPGGGSLLASLGFGGLLHEEDTHPYTWRKHTHGNALRRLQFYGEKNRAFHRTGKLIAQNRRLKRLLRTKVLGKATKKRKRYL